MTCRPFRDKQRAVSVVTAVTRDAEMAQRVVTALVSAGVELPHPVREWIRENLPSGPQGFVLEDLDQSIHLCRAYGTNYDRDDDGMVKLLEFKHGQSPIGESKSRTFGLIDKLCKSSPLPGRYYGAHTVRFSTNGSGALAPPVLLNGKPVDRTEFRAFLNFEEPF